MANDEKTAGEGQSRELRNVGIGAGAGAVALVGIVVAVELAPVALVGAVAGACVYGVGKLCSWW